MEQMTKFEAHDALAALGALAQPWRLETYRLLARYLPFGLPAGDIARALTDTLLVAQAIGTFAAGTLAAWLFMLEPRTNA
jgi:hypothetical protein